MAYLGPVHWKNGEPDLAEYDIDNTGEIYLSPRSKNSCPICGEPKLIGSKTCLPCYRTSRKNDENWRGSAAWKAKHGLIQSTTTLEDEPTISDLNLYVDPNITFCPTPLNP
jgi:hypothetical protein